MDNHREWIRAQIKRSDDETLASMRNRINELLDSINYAYRTTIVGLQGV